MTTKAVKRRAALKAPFPGIGGKGAIRDLVWERFGAVDNYIEPFAYTLAVMLGNPRGPATKETINDLNCYVANFWRSVQADPMAVAELADWPVNEADLHARHRWLVESEDATTLRTRILTDPTYHDARIAGWWAWGQCLWIGTGWCSPEFVKKDGHIWRKRPTLSGGGGNGKGLGAGLLAGPRPQLGDAYSRGRGLHANDAANTCAERREWVAGWMTRLADRLRNVRVCCGDWSRVCNSKTTTTRLGITGIFLDPPYRTHLKDGTVSRNHRLYSTDSSQDVDKLNDRVLAYCVKHGANPMIRMALCSLEGEGNEVLVADHGWTAHSWQSSGYGTSKKGRENAARERVYFSPHTIIPERDLHPLFAGMADY